MQPIISIHKLSKQYRLGVVSSKTLTADVQRWWARMRGKEDPFLKIGETNVRSNKGDSEYVWALKDISFDVMPGEVLGIIGKNGAGKSTLLKILSKVTGPTTGRIDFNGRIGSLLEVGTGFHPELTGRENIFLNGAILGMTKAEIRSKLDEIVDFAGVERYIDTPVKRYSSGMMVRLGFAVAAHLEPEILVVDEVLAVGDAEFQKKAIGKMQDVSRNEGRTVLFVSHNMAAVQNLCSKAVLLRDGTIDYHEKVQKVIDRYIETCYTESNNLNLLTTNNRTGDMRAKLIGVNLYSKGNERTEKVFTGDPITIEFIILTAENNLKNIDIGFSIHDYIGDRLAVIYSSYFTKTFSLPNSGEYKILFKIPEIFLGPGLYSLRTRILVNGIESDWLKEAACSFEVEMGDFYRSGTKGILENTKFLINGSWA